MEIQIIAEAGVNHNGSLANAIKLAELAKNCGANAVKYQTFKAELNVSKHSKLAEYQKNAGIDKPGQLELQKEQELTVNEWISLKKSCDEIGIEFLSTPDDTWSIQLLLDLGVKRIKVASAELNNLPFLEEIAETQLPIILSTGMGTLKEIEEAVNVIDKISNKPTTLLHCTSNYPVVPIEANLNVINTFKRKFMDLPIGYSDHTLGYTAAVIAVALGATVIEKHITLDKSMSGPDHQASANPEEFKFYIDAIRTAEKMLGDGKKVPQKSEISMLVSMRRSIVARREMKLGHIIEKKDLIFKRPGDGISPKLYEQLLGKALLRDVSEDELIDWDSIA